MFDSLDFNCSRADHQFSSILSLRKTECDRFVGSSRDRCLRSKYDAVLNALSEGTELAGVARKRAAIVDNIVS
jgi:hypothetical protein